MIQIPLKAGYHRTVTERHLNTVNHQLEHFWFIQINVTFSSVCLYVFCFSNGKRVFCDGPFSITFQTYRFPPNQVKWCEAESDLWKTFGLTFVMNLTNLTQLLNVS